MLKLHVFEKFFDAMSVRLLVAILEQQVAI